MVLSLIITALRPIILAMERNNLLAHEELQRMSESVDDVSCTAEALAAQLQDLDSYLYPCTVYVFCDGNLRCGCSVAYI